EGCDDRAGIRALRVEEGQDDHASLAAQADRATAVARQGRIRDTDAGRWFTAPVRPPAKLRLRRARPAGGEQRADERARDDQSTEYEDEQPAGLHLLLSASRMPSSSWAAVISPA